MSSKYIDFSIEKNAKDLKYKVGEYVRISKYKNIFAKSDASIYFEKYLLIVAVKSTVPWTYVIEDLKEVGIVRTSYEIIVKKIRHGLRQKK